MNAARPLRQLLPRGVRRFSGSVDNDRLRFISSWFCPFAQRAWIALEHHAIDYEWVESLDWHADGSYKKHPLLLEHNPRGLIPTILGPDPKKGQVVVESSVCVEFTDDYASVSSEKEATRPVPLMPLDPYLRARARVAVEWVNKRLCSPYYAVLVRKDDGERRAAFEKLLASLRIFSAALESGSTDIDSALAPQSSDQSGPFWGRSPTLTAVDVAFIPWACRYYALAHYRGPDFSVPTADADPSLAAYHRWAEAAFSLPSVKPTIPDESRYLAHVSKYADGSAQSKVGDAVRAGRPAHDLDV